MKRSSGPREAAHLSESVNRRLNKYALAASAAGVGLLAFSIPAEGKVIYTAIHHVIPERASFQLDLDHDKNIDFAISNRVTCGDSGCWYSLALNPVKGNAGLGHHFSPFYFPFALALKTGARIGHGAKLFIESFEEMAVAYNGCSQGWCTFGGLWVNVRRRYLGLRFNIKGKTHYGWARLNVEFTSDNIAAVLTGYAYETVPGKSIKAGQTKDDNISIETPAASLTVPSWTPATLARLALGSVR